MATAQEKQAAQDARDAARQSITQGQQRQAAEIGRAAAAFPQRRLRTSGDLSRYAIGGFLSDPGATPGVYNGPGAPVTPRTMPAVRQQPGASGIVSGGSRPQLVPRPAPVGSGSGVSANVGRPAPVVAPGSRFPGASKPGLPGKTGSYVGSAPTGGGARRAKGAGPATPTKSVAQTPARRKAPGAGPSRPTVSAASTRGARKAPGAGPARPTVSTYRAPAPANRAPRAI